MRLALFGLFAFLALTSAVQAQTSKSVSQAAPPEAAASKGENGAELALEKTIGASGSDRVALVRNLQQYLLQYPDAPRKAAVYRALVEACEQLQDDSCALNYAERLIAIQPDDSDMMLVAVDYLQRKGDDASLTRASGYITRVLDRVEKSGPEQRTPRESVADWRARHDHLRSVLYYLAGQVENSRHNYDAAVKDLQSSYAIRPTAVAAEMLGGIAEMKGDSNKAIDEYTLAFVLPDTGPGAKADRHEIRQKLGNVWRAVHGSEQGMGDAILAAYDRLAVPVGAASGQAENKEGRDVFTFVLRRLDGTPMSLSTLRGKSVVLNFWATWCGPCAELQPKFNEVAKAWAGEATVSFLEVNTDEDQTRVPPFVEREKWDVPVVYADGLDNLLKVRVLPTVIVLNSNGRVVYRVEGLALPNFAASLSAAIQNSLGTTP
jgi:thiol-disulfide isomerase/thioredoxin/tetratricopeptide (TPR) repeat protein